MTISASSPVTFAFNRNGGADIQAEVQVWIKKDVFNSNDRPVVRLPFHEATQPTESKQINLSSGTYVCVALCLVREALNGVFDFRFDVAGTPAYAKNGDVNTTPNPNDLQNFKSDFDLNIA